MAVTVDGVKQDEMPTNPMGKDNKYYKVEVNCGSSKTEGLWDYNAWRLNLDYIESNSKCNLTFTSNMSKAQYDEYIKSGVALRRNTYRGKDITKYKDLPEDDPMNLYNQISSGTFADIYVGDYIVSSTQNYLNHDIIWLVADLDNYYLTGSSLLSKHHATIIPSNEMFVAKMNDTNTTTGGYKESGIIKILDEKVLPDYLVPDFGSHVIEYSTKLTNTVNDGKTSSSEWVNRKLDLMSEVNVFGTTIWSSSGYDVGIDNRQYAIFQLKPEFISINIFNGRFSYWLKSVYNDRNFIGVNSLGDATVYGAAGELVVRPRFLIG